MIQYWVVWSKSNKTAKVYKDCELAFRKSGGGEGEFSQLEDP